MGLLKRLIESAKIGDCPFGFPFDFPFDFAQDFGLLRIGPAQE